MSQAHWEQRILNGVTAAAQGDRKRLLALAQMLEDQETAHDFLVDNGFGAYEDSLLALVAIVVEGHGHEVAS